jgi:Mat/Ecp fimbriae periplasmic chaperone
MKYKILLPLFSLILISTANAGIIVDKMVVDSFLKNSKQQNVFVYNDGDEIAYVAIEVFEIKNPGEEDEKRVPVDIKSGNRLIVAPNKLTIEPSEKGRLQFIINDTNLKNDRIYRVSVIPKISGVELNSGIGIKILIGYDLLVISRPDKPKFDLKVLKDKDSITFINNGNTNILLNNVKQCDNTNNCTTILSKRLYAKNKLTAKLIYRGKPIIAEMFYGEEFKVEKY